MTNLRGVIAFIQKMGWALEYNSFFLFTMQSKCELHRNSDPVMPRWSSNLKVNLHPVVCVQEPGPAGGGHFVRTEHWQPGVSDQSQVLGSGTEGKDVVSKIREKLGQGVFIPSAMLHWNGWLYSIHCCSMYISQGPVHIQITDSWKCISVKILTQILFV